MCLHECFPFHQQFRKMSPRFLFLSPLPYTQSPVHLLLCQNFRNTTFLHFSDLRSSFRVWSSSITFQKSLFPLDTIRIPISNRICSYVGLHLNKQGYIYIAKLSSLCQLKKITYSSRKDIHEAELYDT